MVSILQVTVRGSQGHAGTVPMSMRQDPMVAAAELIVSLERLCKTPQDFISNDGPDGHCNAFSIKSLSGSLVCTVGEISTWPSASNVIPGQASTQLPVWYNVNYLLIFLILMFAGGIYGRYSNYRRCWTGGYNI